MMQHTSITIPVMASMRVCGNPSVSSLLTPRKVRHRKSQVETDGWRHDLAGGKGGRLRYVATLYNHASDLDVKKSDKATHASR